MTEAEKWAEIDRQHWAYIRALYALLKEVTP